MNSKEFSELIANKTIAHVGPVEDKNNANFFELNPDAELELDYDSVVVIYFTDGSQVTVHNSEWGGLHYKKEPK